MVRQEPLEYRPIIIGTGNDLLNLQGLSTWILDVRVFVLVLDSIVDEVTMIVDARDNRLQQSLSLVLRYRPIEKLITRNIEKLQCVITKGGGHQLACR